jgi:hypothetical protein
MSQSALPYRVGRVALLAPLLLLLAAGCRSNPSSKDDAEEGPERPIGAIVEATNQPEPIGKVLADLDRSIRAWTSLSMTAQNDSDRRKASQLEQSVMFVAHKRRDELIAELEGGPLVNRIVAASALGFTRDVEAQSPLLAALEDPSVEVVGNALLGLALLGRGDTPLERVCTLITEGSTTVIRSNAALCAANLVQAGARADCLKTAARAGLTDAEPGVRSQCALVLASLEDEESLQRLTDLLYDPVTLVAAAAARSVAYLGTEVPTIRGRAARALVKAYQEVKEPVRGHVLRAMADLAGGSYGDDLEEWKQWAARLP